MKRAERKMSVLYLATFDPTVSATGTATRGGLFLRFFCENFNVHLVHMKEKDSEGKNEFIIRKLASKKTIEYSDLSYFIFSRSFYNAAKKLIEDNQIDFIFADFEKAGLYAYLLKRKYKISYIYSSHNVEYLRYIDFAKRSMARYLFVPYMYFLEKLACQNAIFTISISEKDADTYRKWIAGNRLVVMPAAFDEEAFHPFYDDPVTERPVVLMVGNYRNPGNREGAYHIRNKVLPGVIAQVPNVVFRCIGKNFPEDIRHPNVEIMGFVEDLFSEYQKASVVIVPITIGGGIKIKAIEGIASGKYVIATPKGMEGINTKDLENVSVINIEEFADRISYMLLNPVGKTYKNWKRIKIDYGMKYQMNQLKDRIDKTFGFD